MELNIKRKSKELNSLSYQQAQCEEENQRQIGSPLKQIDFSSNHTEDKSLFEAILEDNDQYEEINHQNLAPSKKRGRKKKMGIQTQSNCQLQSSYIQKKSQACSSKLNRDEAIKGVFPIQNEVFQSFQIKKHQQQPEFDKESQENQSLAKYLQYQSQSQPKKNKKISKTKLILLKRKQQYKKKESVSKVNIVNNVFCQKLGSPSNDNFEQYLNL